MSKETIGIFQHDLDGDTRGARSVAELIANGGDISELRTHALLRDRDWKEIDAGVLQVSRKRLRVTGELLTRGLRYNLNDALGTMVVQSENASDLNAADVNMTGKARGDNDTQNFEIVGVPIPIVSKSWELNARRLRASRRTGEGLDISQARIAARKVSEEIETMVLTGLDSNGNALSYGGYTIYGIENAPNANTGSLTSAWSNSSARDPKADVLAMVQALTDVNKYGPFGFYVPRPYATALGDDYVSTTSTTITIQERLQKIEGVDFIRVADYATAGKISAVELDMETIRIIHGMDPNPVEWKSGDAMTLYHKVMAIMVPELRSDQNGQQGVAVYTA